VTTQPESIGSMKTCWKLLVCCIRLLEKSFWKSLDNSNKFLLPFQLIIKQGNINQGISTRAFNERCDMSVHSCLPHHMTMHFMD